MKILAIDGSLTATGFAVVGVRGGLIPFAHDTAFVATKSDAKAKRHAYQADLDGVRVDAVVAELLRLLDEHQPDVVAIEAPAGSQNVGAAKALALVYGAFRGALQARGLTPIMVQAHHAKRAATGSKRASKDAVVATMRLRFREAYLEGSKDRVEAIADALSVACGALQEPTVQAMARAWLRESERTSALDPRTEVRVVRLGGER